MHVLEVLPKPLESEAVTINRVQGAPIFPSRLQPVGAMNP